MAKVSETKPTERTFTLEVNENELQMIERALYKDGTNDDENGALYADVNSFMLDNGVDTF